MNCIFPKTIFIWQMMRLTEVVCMKTKVSKQEKIVSCVLYSIISIKTATVLLICNFHHIYDNLFHGIFKAFSFQFTLSHQTNIIKT